MTFVVAGMFGLGLPEIIVLLGAFIIFGLGVIWGIASRARRQRRNFSRYSPKCGRGLSQPDAALCSYCAIRLP
jgi:uncharacterized membrane protein